MQKLVILANVIIQIIMELGMTITALTNLDKKVLGELLKNPNAMKNKKEELMNL